MIFSGIQPSGDLHIGNYIGAIKQWKQMQDSGQYELQFCIVDLHAITVVQDPATLRQKTTELAALYMALGIDPSKSNLFIQSENFDHPYLGWIFNCMTPVGWMNRMTQFKEKEAKQKEKSSMGLYSYPTLMAADILLYDTDIVPVGEDQKQHVELTRDIAKRFNAQFGDIFKLPITQVDAGRSARIMSLQDPSSKMSKSDANQNGSLYLLDSADRINSKIKRAVTDSASAIDSNNVSAGLENLLTIMSAVTDRETSDILNSYEGKGYGQFKADLAEAVITFLSPIQKRFSQITNDKSELNKVLDTNVAAAREISSRKITQVRKAMGLWR